MSLADLTFSLSQWDVSKSRILHLRKKVFLESRNLPINFLRHKDDAERYHVIAYEDISGRAIGTGCIHHDGHIGRIAIMDGKWNMNSVAHVIMSYLMHIARAKKIKNVWLNADMTLLDYYVREDFYPMGEPFEYCGLTLQKLEAYIQY